MITPDCGCVTFWSAGTAVIDNTRELRMLSSRITHQRAATVPWQFCDQDGTGSIKKFVLPPVLKALAGIFFQLRLNSDQGKQISLAIVFQLSNESWQLLSENMLHELDFSEKHFAVLF
jgi:hypothetical protein